VRLEDLALVPDLLPVLLARGRVVSFGGHGRLFAFSRLFWIERRKEPKKGGRVKACASTRPSALPSLIRDQRHWVSKYGPRRRLRQRGGPGRRCRLRRRWRRSRCRSCF